VTAKSNHFKSLFTFHARVVDCTQLPQRTQGTAGVWKRTHSAINQFHFTAADPEGTTIDYPLAW